MRIRLAVSLSALLALVMYSVSYGTETGQLSPSCNLAALGRSVATDTGQFKGKVVYVDFWASWCPPCLKSFPFLNTLDHDLRDRGLQVVGVNVDEHVADANAFLQKHPASFVVGSDTKGECPKSFGVMGMPSSYLVDRKGIVRFVHIGFREGESDELRRSIEELLDEDGQAPVAPYTENHQQHNHNQ